jgi:CheY-like chemotaxis protein
MDPRMTEPGLPKYNAGVLIVASNREDRRVLFDSFDGADFDAIYTARDAPQAHALLAQDPELALIFVEFVDPYAEAEGLCRVLAAHPRWRLVPRIGVLAAGASPPGSPGGPNAPVAVWIRSPVSAVDALRQARDLIAPVLPNVASKGDWIEDLAVPALLVDVRTDRVRCANQRAITLLRSAPQDVTSASVRALLGDLPPAREESLGLGEARIDAHGDPRLVGLAVIPCGGEDGRLVLLTSASSVAALRPSRRCWRHFRAPTRAACIRYGRPSCIAGCWPVRNSVRPGMPRRASVSRSSNSCDCKACSHCRFSATASVPLGR